MSLILKLEVNKQPTEIIAVFIYPVVFLFDMFLIQKFEHSFFELSRSFAGNDFDRFDALFNRLINNVVEFPIYLVTLVVYVVKIEF